jgi:hypothetical protein
MTLPAYPLYLLYFTYQPTSSCILLKTNLVTLVSIHFEILHFKFEKIIIIMFDLKICCIILLCIGFLKESSLKYTTTTLKRFPPESFNAFKTLVIVVNESFNYFIFIGFISNHTAHFHNIFRKLSCKHIKNLQQQYI